ncbi:type II secretion system protein GspL [Sphingobium sp. HBC34]|uniref:Type II secretion system protein GspL n=1 Tax=Sphingobium cyanobacteriorum TaxID=3063954 RepID=A0ABT8ZQ77_9SPHN|nr:type II secretion system protein GspL [Sphingobium sp. HBC34]MDO7836109.1 type II secretion system protein GspL [Sphingobium sp. HBC34]
MSSRDALIILLPEATNAPARWMRVIDGALVQSGEGADWLAACGIAVLPDRARVMLVPPAALVTLHWIVHPDLPVRQGRAAARLAALAGSLAPADQLFAATDANDDPAKPHLVAIVSRADMQHWLLWAQHHGLDPDIIVPAPLLLPEPDGGLTRAVIGGETVLRAPDMALTADMALPALIGDAPIVDVAPGIIEGRAIAALDVPPLDLRQGDFAKRVRPVIDKRAVGRIALWSGLILLVSLAAMLIGIGKQHMEAGRLDRESLALARQILPGASDAMQAQAELEARLAARGAGGRAFTAPVASLLAAMQDAPGVAITSLSRDPDGMVRATLAAAKADDINLVLLALQAAGFTITATPSQEPGGRTVADITVRS